MVPSSIEYITNLDDPTVTNLGDDLVATNLGNDPVTNLGNDPVNTNLSNDLLLPVLTSIAIYYHFDISLGNILPNTFSQSMHCISTYNKIKYFSNKQNLQSWTSSS